MGWIKKQPNRCQKGAYAPLHMYIHDKEWEWVGPNEKWCWDCNAAGTVMKTLSSASWRQARVAVSNVRRESYRAPNLPITPLLHKGLVRPSVKGALDKHLAWLDDVEDDIQTLVEELGEYDGIN